MKISVLVPTANRPDMLRTALRSISEQTALHYISEVVVVENLGDWESKIVCKEFSALPIRYIFLDPPIPPGVQTSEDIVREIKTDYMAILFDDDWWMPEHLEYLIESMESSQDAVAASCAYLMCTGEEGYILGVGSSFLPWFAATSPLQKHRYTFKLPDLLVASQIATPFAFMTLLVKTDVWMKCLRELPIGNVYDTDRLMFAELGRYGTLVHDMRPHIYARSHPRQECARLLGTDESLHWWKNSSQRLRDLAKKENINLKEEFTQRLEMKGVDVEMLRHYSHYNSLNDLISRGIIPPQISVDTNQMTVLRKIFYALTPPILQRFIRSIRRGKIPA